VFHSEGVLRAERGVSGTIVGHVAALGPQVEEAPEPFGAGQAVWIAWKSAP